MVLIVTIFFFFNDTATTEIYTLSLHDALPIYLQSQVAALKLALYAAFNAQNRTPFEALEEGRAGLLSQSVEVEHVMQDRKSTRLNSSHANISYAVFCLKKKKHSRI